MATPHVSGCGAVAWSANTSLAAQQIRGILDGTALDLGPPGWDPVYGFGLVDCAAAAAAVVP
jgi:subtilisin family serine protease